MDVNSSHPRPEGDHPVSSIILSLMKDSGFRSSFDVDPIGALSQKGMKLPADVEVRLSENTDKVVHMVFPPDPNATLSDETLNISAGGKTAGSAGSLGSFGTVGSFTTSVSTAGSVASVGSAASGN